MGISYPVGKMLEFGNEVKLGKGITVYDGSTECYLTIWNFRSRNLVLGIELPIFKISEYKNIKLQTKELKYNIVDLRI